MAIKKLQINYKDQK